MRRLSILLVALVLTAGICQAQTSLPISGKGMWIWKVWTPPDSNLVQVIDKLKAAGVTWLVLKMGNSDSYYNRSGKLLYNWAAGHGGVDSVISTFHRDGIKVFGYQYVYGTPQYGNGISEADVANMILDIHGLDGLLIDAEMEYETLSNNSAAATAYLDSIRAHHPTSFIGLTAWARVASHINFPWTAFLDGVEVNMPQTYWAARPTTPATELSRMSSDFTYYTAQWDSAAAKPIMPLGQGEYFGYSNDVYPGDITSFCNLSQKTYGYHGVSLWEYGQIDSPYVWTEYAAAWAPTKVSEAGSNPTGYALYQNYPNPFNPSTAIGYRLSAASHVSLKVYDVLGREVRTLVDKVERMGKYKVRFDGRDLPSGVYFYRLTAGRFSSTQKMIILK